MSFRFNGQESDFVIVKFWRGKEKPVPKAPILKEGEPLNKRGLSR